MIDANNKHITVAIPVYNGAKFLTFAIRSIFKQTYRVNEILIVDDSSTDNTKNVVKELNEKYKTFNIKYICNEKNMGYPVNWNRCFELCKNDYLIILHQDDKLLETTVEKQVSFLQNHLEIALVGGLEDGIDNKGNIIRKKSRTSDKIYKRGEIYEFVTETGSYIPCSSVMFDIEKIRTVGYFDTDVIATDELYWPKVLTKYPIAILGESLIYRRSHDAQTEYRHFVEYEKDAKIIYEKFKRISDYEDRYEYKKKVLHFLKWKFSRSWIGIGVNVAKQGYKIIPIKYIIRAIKINPAIILYFPKMWKSFAKIIIFIIGFNSLKKDNITKP